MNEFPIVSGLARLPEKALVDERALARIFHVSTRTISRWVQCNALPVPARFGAKRVWIAGRILAFIEARVAAAEGIIQRNVGTYLLALVLYFVANMASQIGIVLCCVGVFPLGFWSFCILAWGLGEVARRDPVLTGTAPVPAY